MEEHSKFIMEMPIESVAFFGLDTPISLDTKDQQNTFKWVTNQHLKRIFINIDPLTMVAMKMILEKGHLEEKKFFRTNAHIVSHFLASFLDCRTSKVEAKVLMGKPFKKSLLGGMDDTLKVDFLNKDVPLP